MKEIILQMPPPALDNQSSSDKEDYQLDSVSTVSYPDDEDEEKGVVVVPENSQLPVYGSISLVNSNDVHFGNKTVYKGPVTIKQIVYPTQERVDALKDTCDVSVKCGVDNASFEKNELNVNNVFSESLSKTKDVLDTKSVATTSNTANSSRFAKGFQCFQFRKENRRTEALIISAILVVLITVLCVVFLWKTSSPQPASSIYNTEEDNNEPISYDIDANDTVRYKVKIVKRLQWLAQPPTEKLDELKTPVSLVIIQHTATETCDSQSQCVFLTRYIQNFHIESQGWSDIGYNFLVGGDGEVYEGRSWTSVGSHTFSYNNRSLGIAFIGTFTNMLPTQNQVNAFHKLMIMGVDLGYLTKNYGIVAARQLQRTESPGKRFYEEVIKKWKHWSSLYV